VAVGGGDKASGELARCPVLSNSLGTITPIGPTWPWPYQRQTRRSSRPGKVPQVFVCGIKPYALIRRCRRPR
jgi:hypothetical protein